MFSMFSELTPRAPIPDSRMERIMQPCSTLPSTLFCIIIVVQLQNDQNQPHNAMPVFTIKLGATSTMSSTTPQLHNNMSSTTPQLHNSTTPQLHNSTTPHQYELHSSKRKQLRSNTSSTRSFLRGRLQLTRSLLPQSSFLLLLQPVLLSKSPQLSQSST